MFYCISLFFSALHFHHQQSLTDITVLTMQKYGSLCQVMRYCTKLSWVNVFFYANFKLCSDEHVFMCLCVV